MADSSPSQTCGDADLLIEYLTHQGVTIPPVTLAAVEQVRQEEADNRPTAKGRMDFCTAYSALAKFAAPVTAESLRDCSEQCGQPWKRWWWSATKPVSKANQAVLRHHTWASVALIVLLVVQIYWLIGATLISGIKRQDQHQTSEQTTSAPAPSPSASPSNPTEEDAKEDTHVWLLSAWSAVWKWIPDLYQRWFPDPTLQNDHFWELYIGTKFVLQILQIYVLPLLYGWVGSMAFVLRSLIMAVKNKTFRVELNVEYRLRVYLGLLAGLVIGWFLSPKSDSHQFGVADLTPAAVSFLAGYSVEILFSTMDRIVAGFVTAFGGSTLQTPQTPKDTTPGSGT